jgi:hypothetical protein
MRPKTKWIPVSALVLAAVLTACDNDPTGPATADVSREDIIHAFSAVTFTTVTGGVTTDQLAEGATLDITLYDNGSTTGSVFVPGTEEGDFYGDLTGTFSFSDSNDRVTFDQVADTFVRDMTFVAVRSQDGVELRGDDTFQGTAVHLVLR